MTRFKIMKPTSGGWFCFDLHVVCGDNVRIYRDVTWNGKWYANLWHWIAGPFRKWRKW